MPRRIRNRKRFQKGRMVNGEFMGPGSVDKSLGSGTRDDVPALLTAGEYVISAPAVRAVGEKFLDKVNLTGTNRPGSKFGPGELPSPARYKRGGKVVRKRMKRGGRARKRFQTGGHSHDLTPHSHELITDKHGRLGPANPAALSETIPDNWDDATFGYEMRTGIGKQGAVRPYAFDWAGISNPDPYTNPALDGVTTETLGTHEYHPPSPPIPPRKQLPMKRGGRARKRFQTGGHAHKTLPYFHSHRTSMDHHHAGPFMPVAQWESPSTTQDVHESTISNAPNDAYRFTRPRVPGKNISDPEGYFPFPQPQIMHEFTPDTTPGTHPHRPPHRQMRNRGGRARKRFQRGGRSHFHPYSKPVQQHWGRYPGGRSQGTKGYSHSHMNNLKRGGLVGSSNNVGLYNVKSPNPFGNNVGLKK